MIMAICMLAVRPVAAYMCTGRIDITKYVCVNYLANFVLLFQAKIMVQVVLISRSDLLLKLDSPFPHL